MPADAHTLHVWSGVKAIGGPLNAARVAVPALEQLKVNYRTHSGIMNVRLTHTSSALLHPNKPALQSELDCQT